MKVNRETRGKLLLFFLIIFFMSCENDNFLETINNEHNFQHYPYTISESENNKTVYFKIPDTGQSTVFERGDDASYTGYPNPINLVVQDNIYGKDDIVWDQVTGLVWTKCTAIENKKMDVHDNCAGIDEIYNWEEALSLCNDLSYAGENDWRLPAVSELFSIVDFGYKAPAIDPNAFPNTQGETGTEGKYWTSIKSKDFNLDLRWRLNFNSIDGPETLDPLFFLNLAFPDEYLYVRCVRGPE